MKHNARFRPKVGQAVLALSVAALACSAAYAANPVMKIGHVAPKGDPRDLAANHVAQILRESKSCPMDAQVFAAGQLGATTDLIEGMQIGSIEAVILPGSFLVGFQPLMGIFDFPFLWPDDQEELLAVHDSPAVRTLLDTTNKQGIYSVKVWHTGYKQWTANEPLRSTDDFRGKRARVMPSAVLIEQQKALGLTPVDMPFPETYNALQSGAIAAQENPVSTSYLMALHEVQKALTMTNHGNLDQIFMVSKAWFDALPEDCRKALTEAVDTGAKTVVDETNKSEAKAMEAMKAAGVEIVELTPEQRAALQEATLPKVRAFFIKQNGDAGREILESIEAEINKE
ncbi:TRAP transporter substrate-binding protein [Pusillimonas sp. CC-YST705]|uniref:TRAP transporter substrate-binding protein n=1 Tax=Mesopusillimonas faecipullorum TaxID=2755040 RepID=A0ABS8C985_9BURK|nr:TRAP transporter substrate-binding protein [Mesopusillimonas faecipullorum]MCB5362402.1 TRAP transporter substrate-binding protein [Mesopusillimonas faecipullorum]